MTTSTSSASGRTATVAVDVWIRPLASVAGTRCTRWTPLSYLSRLYAPRPWMPIAASLNPPRPVGLPSGEDRLLGRGQSAQLRVRFAGQRLRLLELAGDPPVVLVGGDDLREAGMFARHLLIPPLIAENRGVGQGAGQFFVAGLQRCETGQHFRAHSSLLRMFSQLIIASDGETTRPGRWGWNVRRRQTWMPYFMATF